MHPRSKHWHLIDYIIVRRKDRQDVRVTKAMCGAECWPDHRLVVSKLNIHIKPKGRPQGKKTAKRLNVGKLKVSTVRSSFVESLEERLNTFGLSDDVESSWAKLRELVYNTAAEKLGPSVRKHQD